VKVQVCCIVGGDPTCAPIGEGCSGTAGDAGDGGEGGVASQPLQCTTYRVCNSNGDYGNECCWSAAQGSECKDDCRSGELRLCQEGDNCGYNASCVRIPDDPLGPGVRRCVNDGSGTSGSSGWNGSSGGGGSSGPYPF
jgi:hypothetical protein